MQAPIWVIKQTAREKRKLLNSRYSRVFRSRKHLKFKSFSPLANQLPVQNLGEKLAGALVAGVIED